MSAIIKYSPVAPSDFDRLVSGYRLTQTALLGDSWCYRFGLWFSDVFFFFTCVGVIDVEVYAVLRIATMLPSSSQYHGVVYGESRVGTHGSGLSRVGHNNTAKQGATTAQAVRYL